MPEELPIRRVEVSFVGTAPAQQVSRASGVSDVETDGSILRCLVCGSFQPFMEALRGHEVVGFSSTSATFGVFAVVVGGQPGGSVYRDILASPAIGILMDAFLVRTLLVPSTVALLGRWNWWPSTHGKPVDAPPDLELADTLSRKP